MRIGVHQVPWWLLAGAIACTPRAEETAETDAVEARRDTVMFETTAGRIVMELENELAPISVENFLLHVRSGFYDGLVFHRVEPGFVIQAGEVDPDMRKRISSVFPIENEATNGLKNLRGTVAMARTGDPHSATSQFFINLADNAKLDFTAQTATGWGYAVFGRVIEGMDAVDSITRISTTRQRTYAHLPIAPPVITHASIVSGR